MTKQMKRIRICELMRQVVRHSFVKAVVKPTLGLDGTGFSVYY